jgi:outer membrane protein TolC
MDVEKAYRRMQRIAGLASVEQEALGVRREALRIFKDQLDLGLCEKSACEEANAADASAEADLAAEELHMAVAAADLDRLSGSDSEPHSPQ